MSFWHPISLTAFFCPFFSSTSSYVIWSIWIGGYTVRNIFLPCLWRWTLCHFFAAALQGSTWHFFVVLSIFMYWCPNNLLKILKETWLFESIRKKLSVPLNDLYLFFNRWWDYSLWSDSDPWRWEPSYLKSEINRPRKIYLHKG